MSLSKQIRRHTPEYAALVAYIESRLTVHRTQLESESHPVEKVPGIRSRIAELKTLLSQLNEEHEDE
jgi:hypothetical protein